MHLGMLTKANKFSRVLALQNSSKGGGMFFGTHKRPIQPEQNLCFVIQLFTAGLLCLIESKSLCALKRAHTLAKSNPLCSKKCVETNACEIVTAPWSNGKEALKWHKFALCEATLPVKNQDAGASQCKGRSVQASMALNCYSHHCPAKLRHRTLCSFISMARVQSPVFPRKPRRFRVVPPLETSHQD